MRAPRLIGDASEIRPGGTIVFLSMAICHLGDSNWVKGKGYRLVVQQPKLPLA
jgi:hypothetical protein